MTSVYLAYPIDQTTGEPRQLASIREFLAAEASWVFDPGAAFTVGPSATPTPAIREINRGALAHADILVAVMPAGVASVGVPMEVERAVMLGKPALVVSDAPSWMLQLGGDAWVFPDASSDFFHQLGQILRQGVPVVPTQEPMAFELDEGAVLPYRSHPDDAGLDLVITQDVTIHPGQFVDVPCGAKVQLPEWSWGLITGRSSTLRKRGLMVNQGVIDAGYRGPLFAGVWNLTDEAVTVARGERLAQLVILDNGTQRVRPVQGLINQGSRGTNGFGSTGS